MVGRVVIVGLWFVSLVNAADEKSAVEGGHRAFAKSNYEEALQYYAEASPKNEAIALFFSGCILLETRKWTEAKAF
ncbi:MAG: hypothetical protein AAF585_10030 [Verrucomicrobiota bacterium]